MGCDIHVHVEYKNNLFTGYDADNKPQYESKWICGDYFHKNPYFGSGEDEKEWSLVGLCDSRNYAMFSVLANVRNYGKTEYIDEPRGLPKDVTEMVKEDADDWGVDGHSHSYLTLKELIDFQNKQTPLRHRGMISPEQQKDLDENGIIPGSWCQGTNIPGYEFREWETKNEVLLPMIEALKTRADELYFIYRFSWDRDYEECYQKAENIRIVFWFDN